ncbi:hypothetical protein [Streptomyces fradiae]|uniref:hypothetical protein n=1 Tax=Streptomyces fradiae TaxID=1906 RepID=UPI003512F57B
MTSLRHPELSGLGRNPAAPEDLLVRLAAHDAGRHGLTSRRGRLPDAVAEAMLRHGGADAATLMYGDRISPATRRLIAAHPDPAVRDAHASFVRDIVAGGSQIGFDHLEEAYGRPRTELMVDPDPAVRAVVARCWHDRPLDVQERFLADPAPEVRAAATEQAKPGVPPESVDRFLADPAVRGHLAGRVPLTWEAFTTLVDSGDERLVRTVAGNPYLTAGMVTELLDSTDPSVRISLALSRHVDPATRDHLFALVAAESAAGSIPAMVALCWNMAQPDWLREVPLGERLTYLDCPHARFRRALAACPDLPAEAWRRLDADPDVGVRRIAARRPDAPPEVLEALLREHGEAYHTRQLIVDHPRFPRHRLRTLVDAPGAGARFVVLRDPELPLDHLRRLAADPEAFVRAEAARHPRLPEGLLDVLLADQDPKVVEAAAAHPGLGRARMEGMLMDVGL